MAHLSLKSYGVEIERHAHDFHQIVLPRRGSLAMEIAGCEGAVQIAAGTSVAALIPAGESHSFQAGIGDQFVVLDLAADDDGIDTDQFLQPFFALAPAQQALLTYLEQACDRFESIAEPWCQLLLASLAPSDTSHTQRPLALDRALELMRTGFAGDLGIADISHQAGISETRLFALFRRHLGLTPHGYLSNLRLDAAEQMLARTTLPIAEIAWRSGHGDQASLTRRMRQRRGITPAAYRRRSRG
jgi:AraC-like DNA-binding protein